jgi:hypothetical protein
VELRTGAIHTNYRALADMTAAGGYGVLYGPNIDLQGSDTLGEGKIAGHEYTAYADTGNGRRNVTMVVQIPDAFDPATPCIVPVNHASRPYYGLNKMNEGEASEIRYYEVTNAQHFEAFIGLPSLLGGYDSRYIPMHVYGTEALNRMYARLTAGTPLPPSQVVRTIPRGGAPRAAPPISTANVPPFADLPLAGDAITFAGNTLGVPD